MPDNRGLLREVAWQELFPWLILLRTLRLAIDFRKLALAAIAIVLTALGWWLIAWAADAATDTLRVERTAARPWDQRAMMSPALGSSPARSAETGSLLYVPWREARRAFEANALWLTGPFRELFSRSASAASFAVALLAALWALVVWSFFGGAITRIAAVELALEERLGLRAAVRHAARKWPAYFAGPLMPLVLIVLLAVPLAVLGLIMRLDLGLLLGGLLWPLVLVCGLIITLAFVGLLLGWPLMWATISVDATDSFDAFGRSYSYVYQRPLNYLFYAVVSLAIGVVGWIVVSTFAALVIHLSAWGVSWGSGGERLRELDRATAAAETSELFQRTIGGSPAGEVSLDSPGEAGASLISFWTRCVRLLVLAFGYSFFWTASTGIYLLLRRDADAKEIDEIYFEGRVDESELPPLRTDAAGVQVLADAPPTENAATTQDVVPPEDRDQNPNA